MAKSNKKKTSAKKATVSKRAVAKKNAGNKSEDKQYKSLYQKIWRRKKLKREIAKKKGKGWKSKRTKVYKEIVVLNKQLMALCKKKKYKIPDSVKLRIKKRKEAEKKGTEYFAKEKKKIIREYNVWNFERELIKYLNGKRFKTVVFPDVKKSFTVKGTSQITILFWYDKARDKAYEYQFAGTPLVVCEEDYENSTLTITIE